MIVPDALTKCTVFLGCRVGGSERRGGTAFLMQSDVPGDWGAVVTARHVIDNVRSRSDDGQVILWLNGMNGGVAPLESHVDKWIAHTDPTADVAILPVLPPLSAYDHQALRPKALVHEYLSDTVRLGVGDEVYLAGLFAPHSGKARNIPILRGGMLATMRIEPVDTALGPMDAYLAEVRSIGGLSGSPVFLHVDMWRVDFDAELDDNEDVPGLDHGFYLLGLMHGHYDVRRPDFNLLDGSAPEAVNMGIGIVVPSERIGEVLALPQVAAARSKESTTD